MEITLEHVFLTYRKDIQALYDINLRITPGIYGLLGPGGAGKSSLLKILATIVRPSWGEVRVGPYALPREQHRVRELLGYLPRPCPLFDNMTAAEFLDYMALLKGLGGGKERSGEIERLLPLVDLKNTNKRIKSFSGGMKQRLALAQALIGSPPVLLLDEPLAGLEPAERERLGGLLREMKGDRLILLAAGSAAEISTLCHRLAVIHRGRIIFEGAPAELAEKAGGKVWEVVSGDEDYVPGPEESIISSRREDGRRVVRLLAPDRPVPGAVPAVPAVEDGYIALVINSEGVADFHENVL